MKLLVFSPAAQADIGDIWDYSADLWGPDQADRYTDEIRDTCHALATGHRTGQKTDVRQGYLKILTGSHVVFFRDHGDRLEIMRVLHGRQDAQRYL